ncbi:ABC transporter permease subunit [Planococcaceae bacterium Storch 2/2-2]|nr:ABC transporter permease subunit [Planococcaceae bacterium Storch 2/2-2]
MKEMIYTVMRGGSLLFGLSVLTFTLVYYSPVDPIQAYIGGGTYMTEDQRQQLEEKWGLNDHPVQQYVRWATALLGGDFGQSTIYQRPVSTLIQERAGATLLLMTVAWTVSGLFGFTLGVWAAVSRGRMIDRLIRWYSYIQASVPTFWLGLLLLMIFSVYLQWFPVGLSAPPGKLLANVTWGDRLYHLWLPALTLSVIGTAQVTLHTREKMINVLESDYVLFAKARGASTGQIVKRHGLKNAVLPALMLHFSYVGELFGGSVLAEQVFSYPGLGAMVTEAGLKADVPLLLGIVLCSSVFVFIGNVCADFLKQWIDPRTKKRVSYDAIE